MSEFVQDSIRKIAIVAGFACSAVMAFALLREAFLGNRIGLDYSVYWRAANEPVEMAYSLRNMPPFPYAPTMLLWISPFSLVSKLLGYLIISLLGILGFFVACRPHLTRAALLLAMMSGPMVRCIRNGQVSAILAALLIWACGTRNRIAAGVATGVIASIKPQFVIMAPFMFALNKDWRAFLASGTSFLALVLLSLLFGPERWAEWITSMSHFRQVLTEYDVVDIGVTPAVVAESLGFPPPPFLILGAIMGAVLVYLCQDLGPLEKATAIGAGSLLAAPYALVYDLVVIVPFVAATVLRGRIASFIPVAGMLHPLPLIITSYEVLRGRWLIPTGRSERECVQKVASS